MPIDEEANNAIAALNESELGGKEIVVKEANPPIERPRRDFNPVYALKRRDEH